MQAATNAGGGQDALPAEIAVVGVLFVLDAIAVLVTYSRVPAHELYHVSHSGIRGGVSRVLVFSNFSAALAAIAVWLVLLGRTPERVFRFVAFAAIALCAAVFWPGVVDQANLDAKPVNAIAGTGVLLAFVVAGRFAMRGRRWMPRQPGDRLRVVVAAVAVVLAAPWIAAELGFFLDGVPVVGRLFQTRVPRPADPSSVPPYPPAVHHGHHHGMDGLLLLSTALLLSRVLPSLKHGPLRVLTGAYLALMVSYAAGNMANDDWGEQIWKRNWTSWRFPGVLQPKASVAWGVVVAGAAVLYAASAWWSRRATEAR